MWGTIFFLNTIRMPSWCVLSSVPGHVFSRLNLKSSPVAEALHTRNLNASALGGFSGGVGVDGPGVDFAVVVTPFGVVTFSPTAAPIAIITTHARSRRRVRLVIIMAV
ncbi:JM11 [macacine gammaherpesvirus 11]|uniref:JM11 n=2 Tax=macacine gammaherpesvirus 11 TaxID=2560570 RepID=G9JMI9_9GAMA|nr:JM11 [Macaca fuscata rhadinovirus]AAS99988.1 JM11 [Macaca fuscata rhadinovirus]AEW87536.1 JM11 [Macaca fuscata rhadinovirus]AEW87706.1 JM11 [Macaca fuscata rhadinovirus]